MMGSKMAVTARVKHNFSRQHLIAARRFADLCAGVELMSCPTEQDRSDHRAYATSAVIFSVAFLEGSINELYMEAVDGNRNSLSGLSDQQIAILAELWQIVEQHPVLNKYQIALAVCGVQRFDKGAEPFQGTDGLVKIRNVLIHYRPEWDHELDEHKKIQERIGTRFRSSPFASSTHLWFPHQCLGAGCARWSVQQAECFIREFCQRLMIPSRLP